MDAQERKSRSEAAAEQVSRLADLGVVAVATTFVDNAGIARVKAVPLKKLPSLAAWGVGFSTAFDRFRANDSIAMSGNGLEPVGDLRIVPDTGRLVAVPAMPGWAWAPGNRLTQDGDPHPQCARGLLRRTSNELAKAGLTVQTAFEIEWVVSRGEGDGFQPGILGPAYGMARLIDQSDYCRDLLVAMDEVGVEVEQFHPEYGAGQLELSVASEGPVAAADTSVLVRTTIRAVGRKHGLRTSFSPKVAVAGVGNGGHVHLSVWRDGKNLMTGGPGPFGLTADAEAFCAGVLDHLPALMAVGAPSPVSYLRLVPSSWAGVYACWGLENREAALRLITGSAGSEDWAANLEVKCFDLSANPYLLLAALLATGTAGIREGRRLPPHVDVDHAVLGDIDRARLGINRVPSSLDEALAVFEADSVLESAFGTDLVTSLAAIRRADIEEYSGLQDADLAAAFRWMH